MHFFFGLKSPDNPNETTVYLGLESSFPDVNNFMVANDFDMQQAKDYLDNLAIAIQPYAADLQLKLQTKNLLHAQAKGQQLASEGINLNQQRVRMMKKMGGNTASSKSERLTKQLAKNQRQIDHNKVSQANQNTEIQKQKLAIVLLTDKD
jgi:putative cell wall-binding protein